jgi:hypothetical protein
MAVWWWIIFASWLCLPRYADSVIDKFPAITCSVVSCAVSHFLICRLLPFLSSASHNIWFWSPGLGWWLQTIPSQDRHSLRTATIGRILRPRDFSVEILGIFPCRVFVFQYSDLLVLLHHPSCFDHLVLIDTILFLLVQTVSLGVLQLIRTPSSYFLCSA